MRCFLLSAKDGAFEVTISEPVDVKVEGTLKLVACFENSPRLSPSLGETRLRSNCVSAALPFRRRRG